jgi:hypothetical protein
MRNSLHKDGQNAFKSIRAIIRSEIGKSIYHVRRENKKARGIEVVRLPKPCFRDSFFRRMTPRQRKRELRGWIEAWERSQAV